MDTGNKIYTSIICRVLLKIISKHAVKCKFGSTSGVRCQYVTFTIKTLLNLIHNKNIPTWVEFTYLVKAFDTSNHVLFIVILGKYILNNKTHVR